MDDISVFSRWIVAKLDEDKKLAEMLYPVRHLIKMA